MMKQKLEMSPAILVLAGLVVLVLGFVAGTRSEQLYAAIGPVFGVHVDTSQLDLSSVQRTYQTLKTHYNGRLNTDKLISGASKGLVEAVGDPYTIYMDSKEASAFNDELSGDIGGGIGAEVGLRNKQPTIIRTLADNPAVKAGLRAGDVVVSVNDQSTVGKSVEETVRAIKGEPGTTVKITVKRADATQSFTITRQTINNPSVTAEVKDGIGIMTISRFDESTVSLARKAASKFTAQNVEGVIVDLRGNGGGYLDAAPGVAGLWLQSDKTVVSVRGNGGDETYKAEGEATLRGIKTTVLVDSNTASAAEIVAGALQQQGAATLVGVKTYGKGTVQEVIPLEGGAQLKVTIKRWYLPKGQNITGKGIAPDVKVDQTQDDLDKGRDPQFEEAKEQLQS